MNVKPFVSRLYQAANYLRSNMQTLHPRNIINTFTTMGKRKMVMTSIFGLLSYHYMDLYYNQDMQIVCQLTEKNSKILKNCSQLTKGSFFPTFYLPNALTQMLYANLVDPQMIPLFTRELFQTRDGGQLALDWMIKEDVNKLIVITHGLTGGTDCNYIKDTMEKLYKAGFNVVCVNQRGVAYSKLTSPKYHRISDPADLKLALTYIKDKYPNAELYGVGISVGANLILKYAGKEEENCVFKAIVSIANPFNLHKCATEIVKPWNFIYMNGITENFKWLLRHHIEEIRPNVETHGIDIEKALLARTPYEFDEYITRRLWGYETVESLYEDINCDVWMEAIKCPILCINSKQDPISAYDAIPFEIIQQNENIILMLTHAGTHVEWFTGIIPTRWVTLPIIEYFKYIGTSC